MKYLAVELFTVEWDGFAGNWETNNFYLYRSQAGRSQLIPKDRDHAFNWDGTNADDFINAPITLRLDTNVLTRRAMADPQLRQIFLDALTATAAFAAAKLAVALSASRKIWRSCGSAIARRVSTFVSRRSTIDALMKSSAFVPSQLNEWSLSLGISSERPATERYR